MYIFLGIVSDLGHWPNLVNRRYKMSHFSISQNSNFKVDLDAHLRDKHGHLFLWDLEQFCRSFKVGQMKIENMQFWWLSRNWVLKVHLGALLRDNHGHLFLWYFELFWPSIKVGQTKVENMNFYRLSKNAIWKWI